MRLPFFLLTKNYWLVVNVKLLFIDKASPLFCWNFYGNFVFVLRNYQVITPQKIYWVSLLEKNQINKGTRDKLLNGC